MAKHPQGPMIENETQALVLGVFRYTAFPSNNSGLCQARIDEAGNVEESGFADCVTQSYNTAPVDLACNRL